MEAKSQRVFLGLQNTPWWLVDTAASEDTGSINTRRMTAARTNTKQPREDFEKVLSRRHGGLLTLRARS